MKDENREKLFRVLEILDDLMLEHDEEDEAYEALDEAAELIGEVLEDDEGC